MVSHTFDNNYDVVLWAFSALSDRFEKEDKLFAAQCIWWLASIIQFREILTYYRQYKIFPSEYLKNIVVTPLPNNRDIEEIPDGDISPLDLDNQEIPESEEEHLSQVTPVRTTRRRLLNTTRSGRVFKSEPLYQESTVKELEKKFGKQSKKQSRRSRDLLRAKHRKDLGA